MEEHIRQHRRVNVSWPVTINSDEGIIERITYNISPNGAFIRGLSSLELHEFVEMTVGSPDRSITVKARVVWSSSQVPPEKDMPRGMGVEFVKISDEDREFISSFSSGHDFALYLQSTASNKDEGSEPLFKEQLTEGDKEKDTNNPCQEQPKKCPRGHKHLSWSAYEDDLFCWDCNKKYSLAESREPKRVGSSGGMDSEN